MVCEALPGHTATPQDPKRPLAGPPPTYLLKYFDDAGHTVYGAFGGADPTTLFYVGKVAYHGVSTVYKIGKWIQGLEEAVPELELLDFVP
jgi:hypothetical protein